MSMDFAEAVRRATMETRAGRMLWRALGANPAPPPDPTLTEPPAAPPPLPTPQATQAPAPVETPEPAVPTPGTAPAELPAGTTESDDPATAEPVDAAAKAAAGVPSFTAAPAPGAAAAPLALGLAALQSAPLAPPRGPLDDMVRMLSGRAKPADTPATVPVPEGAAFHARSFAVEAGERDYRLYVPASLDGAPRGLILMLHGCTQDPEDFAVGTGMNDVAEREQLLIAYPEQPQAQNSQRCWNWFRPEDQRRGGGEPAILAGLAEALVAEFDVPPGRVFVAGLSAGGAMAAVLGEAYPDLFAAVGVHSGVACGSARDARSAMAAMRGLGASTGPSGVEGPRTIVFQGDADTTVHPSNAARLLVRAVGEGVSGAWEARTVGGRSVMRSVTRGSSAEGAEGREVELWMIEGAGHAWAGGNPAATHAEAEGPHASAEMVRFFLAAGETGL